ncbi:Putative exonuclease V [Septoria linicola]|uniref:Exonuclease V n=1 Tax=Septoria linicola TaxID=215465 RepID=A0A9Q9AWB1_9PEZI|nr:Putative exonuclease V [Septoria linicola]
MFAEYHHRQYFARAFRTQQDGPAGLIDTNQVDSRPENDIDDDTIVKDADESDYGSDLDDATVDALLTNTTLSQPQDTQSPSVKIEDVEEPVLPQRDENEPENDSLRLLRADVEAVLTGLGQITAQSARIREALAQAIESKGQDSRSWPADADSPKVEHDGYTWQKPIKREASLVEVPDENDTRTPIERFRKQRPLTVTDLVSPAWCELQYWYSLTKYGRIKRTPAMKQGSRIHKQIEEQTQVEVRVEVETREDKLGLRLWNIIQGLRGLRATGLTRELEVFGVVDGDVVVGIIDALSHTCPDEKFEAEMLSMQDAARNGGNKVKKEELPADQKTMTDFFRGSQEQETILNSQAAWQSTPQRRRPAKTVYLSDVKTRGVKSVPQGTRMRPTQMQLMLYRRFLNDLAANEVDAQRIFDRYSMDAHAPFSDTFIANMAGIDFTASQQSLLELDDSNDEPMMQQQEQSNDPLDEVLQHNTLSFLWTHMITEFQRTIPVSTISSCISPLLTAEFRTAATGALIGRRSFAYDADMLDTYVKSEMAWWRGEREAQGVKDIEEASYKCRSCKFAEQCTWRRKLDEKAGQKGKLNGKRGIIFGIAAESAC